MVLLYLNQCFHIKDVLMMTLKTVKNKLTKLTKSQKIFLKSQRLQVTKNKSEGKNLKFTQ
jgi:hypothetical protein